MNCCRCQTDTPTAELVAYKGICENCWTANAPPANVGAKLELSGSGKFQKIDGERRPVEYDIRASRDHKGAR